MKKGKEPNVPMHEVRKLVNRAKKEAADDAISLCMTLMLSVLLDKFGMEEQIQAVYDAWNDRAEAVKKGQVKLHEWRNVLRKEYGIKI